MSSEETQQPIDISTYEPTEEQKKGLERYEQGQEIIRQELREKWAEKERVKRDKRSPPKKEKEVRKS